MSLHCKNYECVSPADSYLHDRDVKTLSKGRNWLNGVR